MASSNKNGNGGGGAASSSYQKYDGASGTYQPVDGSDFEDLNSSNGRSTSNSGNKWKMVAAVGLVLAAALGAYYTFTAPTAAGRSGGSSQQQIDKAISSAGSGLQVKSNGRLKLFDSLSKLDGIVGVIVAVGRQHRRMDGICWG